MKKIDVKRIAHPKMIIKDLTETIMPSRKEPLLEFIVLGDGKNLHQTVAFDKKAKYVSERTHLTYEIQDENLLLKKPFWGRRKLVAIFKSDGTPIKIVGSTDKISAETLHLAERSTALSRSVKEMFSKHFDMKKILFFVVIGVIGVVIFMVLTGVIHL